MDISNTPRSIGFVWSYMELLSGGLDDCQDADDETCSAGISAARAFLRRYSDGIDEGSLMISRLDYESAFANMHPLDWGVNRLVLNGRFGYDMFFAYQSLVTASNDATDTQQRDLTPLQTKSMQVLLGNVVVATSHVWSQYTKNIHFDEKTGLAVIVIDNAGDDTGKATSDAFGTLNRVDQVKAVKGLMEFVAQENQARGCSDSPNKYDLYLQQSSRYTNGNSTVFEPNRQDGGDKKCWIPIVVYEDTREELFESFLNEILYVEKNPPAIIAQVRSYALPYNPPQKLGPHGIWVVSYQTTIYTLDQLRLELSDDRHTVTNLTLIEQNLYNIPEEIKDEEFRDDINYMRTLADEARANNPILGTSLAMPAARRLDDTQYTPCMGGECPIGNLFADSLRWYTDSDFAFLNSGGVRGYGWPEGPVRVGNIWESLPFANTQCTGVISGINLFRLFRESTTLATFLGTWTPTGSDLFQVSGIWYTYNTNLDAPRLVRLEIWDKSSQSYQPVERLKMYTFATSSWMCIGNDPYPDLLGKEALTVQGEVPGIVGDTLLQNIVGDYFGSLGMPYNTSIQGRLVNDTSITERLNFIQTKDSCSSSTYWVEELLSCMDCPNTNQVSLEGPPGVEVPILFESESGSDEILYSSAELINGESFPVIIALKSKPAWITFPDDTIWNDKEEEGQKIAIEPGKKFPFTFSASASDLSPGLATGPISFAVLDGGNYPGCVGRDTLLEVKLHIANPPEFSQPGSIMIVGFTLMSAVLLLAMALAAWVYQNKKKREVSSMQPYFLLTLCFGVSTIDLSIVPLSIQGLDVSPKGQDMACMATPWLLSIGFSIVMSTLFSKLWRINKLFSGPRFRRITVTSKETFFAFGTVLSTNLLLMLLWTLIDPLQFELRRVEGETWKVYSTCESSEGKSWIFLMLIIGINIIAMSLAIYEAYKARNISSDYSESKSLGIATYSWIQIILVGFPVLFLIDENNVVPRYFLQVALIFLSCVSMMLIIFVPLIMKSWAKSNENSSSRRTSTLRISGLNFSWFNSEGGTSYPMSVHQSRPFGGGREGGSGGNGEKHRYHDNTGKQNSDKNTIGYGGVSPENRILNKEKLIESTSSSAVQKGEDGVPSINSSYEIEQQLEEQETGSNSPSKSSFLHSSITMRDINNSEDDSMMFPKKSSLNENDIVGNEEETQSASASIISYDKNDFNILPEETENNHSCFTRLSIADSSEMTIYA